MKQLLSTTFPRSDTGSASPGVRALLAIASAQRRAQLRFVIFLTLLGAVAELTTIGAVVPLLMIASDPAHAARIPVLHQLLTPIMTMLGVDAMIAAAWLLSVAAVFATILRLGLNWVTLRFVYGFHRDLVLRILERTLRQPFAWYARQNSSVLLAAVEKVYLITVGLVSPLVMAISSAVMVVIIGTFLLIINPVAALIAIFVVGSVYVTMTVTTRKAAHAISRTDSRIRAARLKVLQESFGGIRDIILDQTHAVFEADMASLESEHSELLAQSGTISLAPRLVVEGVVIILVAALALWFDTRPGGVMHALPVLGALALGSQRLLPMVQIVYFGYVNCTLHRASVGDILALVNLPPEPGYAMPAGASPGHFADRIELRDVSFHYEGSGNAISDISLTIRKGERVGIIGKTGSGKSTLIDLIMGLLLPDEGALLVDDVPLSSVNDRYWKAQVAHVPQGIFLSDDSIAANIAFGHAPETIDAVRVAEAARQAGLDEFVGQLPQGLATHVGERGVRLSGGQRQRIGIARALYKDASVLVLDEATSALDDETEAAVMEAVAGLGKDLTIILIAHRLSTVKICDRVYRLGDGRILDQGSYDAVIAAAS